MMKQEPIRIKSLQTGFEILESLVDNNGAGASKLAEELDRPKSTIHDHLVTLHRMGYLVEEEGKYRIGMNILRLGDLSRKKMKLYEKSKSEIAGLAEKTGEYASLVVEEHGEAVIVATEEGDNAIPVQVFDGIRMTMHTEAPGKAILAFLPEERVHEIIDRHGLEPMTKHTISNQDDLFEELETIRNQRFALDDEERMLGMRSVAVPITDRNERVQGALTIYGPTNRIKGDIFKEDLPELLLQSGNIVEVLLNYD